MFTGLASRGLDLAHELIPIAPASHYFIGGVQTDVWGRTSVAGLYACGETASTGIHGANRLASSSLLEGLVFGSAPCATWVAILGSCDPTVNKIRLISTRTAGPATIPKWWRPGAGAWVRSCPRVAASSVTGGSASHSGDHRGRFAPR